MGFIPNTPEDRKAMLEALGLSSIEELLEKGIPKELMLKKPIELPEPLSEYEALKEAAMLAEDNLDVQSWMSFLGAGAYDHFIPSAVHHIIGRPEFETAYTPYQAEVSQGTLQAIFEFQSMIAMLMGMDVANASVYDGASAVAEAGMLALASVKGNKIVVSGHVHPSYIEVLRTYVHPNGAEIVICPTKGGATDISALKSLIDDDTVAVIMQSPNFVGCIEDGFAFREAIGERKALLVAVTDPISLGMLAPPGDYDADIAVGEGQGLGNPVGFGGPFLGLFAAKDKFVRKMPGRLIGASTDEAGTRGFVMTLQTREQHIRREKATSNICTNEALCALGASVYLALLGETGIKTVARLCYDKAHYLADKLTQIEGLEMAYDEPFFKEFAVKLPVPAEEVFEPLIPMGYLAGVPLSKFYPERENELLIAVTEKRTVEEMDEFTEALAEVLKDF
ncbi:MAG TPA: aminomethyl-transferring glycine dehydrogenase subunit GcvPA [candidate division Zixibacteria bacterium]|nr:aminomethyl-transferring glycine dehydrogenase subunit GcvPA [candidate division Zixibacteria bacterium]